MEKRYYIDGKCVLSYDDDVFSTDDDYTNIKELFIYPAVDKVYVKYYEKQLVQQVLEKTLKKKGRCAYRNKSRCYFRRNSRFLFKNRSSKGSWV